MYDEAEEKENLSEEYVDQGIRDLPEDEGKGAAFMAEQELREKHLDESYGAGGVEPEDQEDI